MRHDEGEALQCLECPLSLLLCTVDSIIKLSSYVGGMHLYVRKYDRFVEPHPLTDQTEGGREHPRTPEVPESAQVLRVYLIGIERTEPN